MKYLKFSTSKLEKIGFIPNENEKEWRLRISKEHFIIYDLSLDILCFRNDFDDESPDLILNIYNQSELVRRLPLLIDFALLVD